MGLASHPRESKGDVFDVSHVSWASASRSGSVSLVPPPAKMAASREGALLLYGWEAHCMDVVVLSLVGQQRPQDGQGVCSRPLMHIIWVDILKDCSLFQGS